MQKKDEIYKLYGRDYRAMTIKQLDRAGLDCIICERCGRQLPADSGLLGSADAKVPEISGIRIGIKPNLVSPTPSDMGATTHTEIVAGIIEYLRGRGFDDIRLMEGSWVGDRTEESFRICGYDSLCRQYGVSFTDAQKDSWHTADCGGLELKICDCVSDVDFMINVPVLKGHGQTHMTCALKNMKGLIPNSEKRHFHAMGLHRPIAHLGLGIRQDFIVIDNICGDPGCEDGGNPVYRNCIMTALDPVLTDMYAIRLLGLKAEAVPYVGMAAELGVGSDDLAAAHILCINDETDELEDFRKAEASLAIKRSRTEVWDHVEQVDSCSACYAYLVPALDRLEQEGLLEKLMDIIPDHRICIGQGFKGMKGHVGVGSCTHGFEHSVRGCPPDDEEIYQYLKELTEQMACDHKEVKK